MLKNICLLSAFVFFLFSCDSDAYKKPEDPLEAGTDFIRFALDGDMAKAKTFVLKDAVNESLFEEQEKSFAEKTKEEKTEYKNATIRIQKTASLNDSTMLINYSNSFKNKDNQIKLVKKGGEWWVDFKYTFTGENALDSLSQ